MAHDAIAATAPDEATAEGTLLQSIVIGLMAFLTVVDLFAAQAILPALATHYGVAPAAMGLAVNASTFGMALRTASHACSAVAAWLPTGTIRVLLPLPVTRTVASAKLTSPGASPASSASRSPDE